MQRGIICAWLLCLVFHAHGQFRAISRERGSLPGITDSAHYVDALNRLAGLYQPHHLDSSLFYVTKAREIANRLEYDKGKADVLKNLGNYYSLRANSYLSYRFYVDALQAYEALGDSVSICHLYTNIGVYYKFDGQRARAVHYINRAMDMGSRLSNDSVYAPVLTYYYSVHNADSTKADSCRWALTTAHNIAARHHDERTLLNNSLYEAHQMLTDGDIAGGKQRLRNIMDSAVQLGYNYMGMHASAQLAAYKSLYKEADSMSYYAKAVQLGLAGDYSEVMMPFITKLYSWYSHGRRTDSAAYYGRLMLDILEKQEEDRAQGELDYAAYLRQSQELTSLQLQHSLQQQELDKKNLESRNRRFFLVSLTVLLALMALLLIKVYRSYRQSLRNSAVLADKYREVADINGRLHSQDDFQNKLISLIAHDFRSPLINIIEITDVLKSSSVSLPEATGMITRVESSSRDILQTFENILQWIRSQLAGFTYAPAAWQLSLLIQDALKSAAYLIERQSIRVVINIPDNLMVMADREMLQFVHRNFIHNAVKFSPNGGVLGISAAAQGGIIKLSVTDEGPGIPEERLPELFDYRQAPHHRDKKQGAGLALIICKDFIDKMGGQVLAINNNGKGATLSYILSQA